jgi:hypothetical protein
VGDADRQASGGGRDRRQGRRQVSGQQLQAGGGDRRLRLQVHQQVGGALQAQGELVAALAAQQQIFTQTHHANTTGQSELIRAKTKARKHKTPVVGIKRQVQRCFWLQVFFSWISFPSVTEY